MDLEKEPHSMILELLIEAVKELLELSIQKEMATFPPHFLSMMEMKYLYLQIKVE